MGKNIFKNETEQSDRLNIICDNGVYRFVLRSDLTEIGSIAIPAADPTFAEAFARLYNRVNHFDYARSAEIPHPEIQTTTNNTNQQTRPQHKKR